jgi:hypothetical protein
LKRRQSRIGISDASLRGDLERALHLILDALHGAGAYAEFAGNLVDALTCAQLLLDAPQRLTGFYGPL